MARRRSKDNIAEQVRQQADGQADVDATPDVRHAGPWDSSERTPDDDPARIDFGPLVVRMQAGFTIRVTQDTDGGDIGALMLVTDDAALELRVFAAAKSGGLWDEVRESLLAEVHRLKGEAETVDGPFGPELRIVVPGDDGPQASRIVGVDGPRWLLRATFLGAEGLAPSDESVLMDALRDVIVVRGAEPRIPGEALLLTMPENAIVAPDEE